MKFIVKRSKIDGVIDIPGSKSHTIRALFFATLADGESRIFKPLVSEDAISSLNSCKVFGGDIKDTKDGYIVMG